MKCFKNGHLLRRGLFEFIQINWKILAFYAFVLFVGIQLFLLSDGEIEFFGQYYTRADCLVRMDRPIVYSVFFIPIISVLVYKNIQNDFCITYLLQYKSKKELFFIQEYKMTLISLFLTILYAAEIGAASSSKIKKVFNWNTFESVFVIKNKCVAEHTIFMHVFVGFLVTIFIRTIILANIIVFAKWICKNVMIGVFLICIISCFEIVQQRIPVLFWVYTIDYPVWIHSRYIIYMLVYTGFYIAIASMLSKMIIRKKEFIGEK